jgi:hypothetical protein
MPKLTVSALCRYVYPCAIDEHNPGPTCNLPQAKHAAVGSNEGAYAVHGKGHAFTMDSDLCERCAGQHYHPIHDPKYGGSHGFLVIV